MTLPPFERMRSLRRDAEGDFETIQDRIDVAYSKLVDQPHLDGILLESVTITTGSNTINHTLGRTLRGYWLVTDDAIPAAVHAYVGTTITNGLPNNVFTKISYDSTTFNYGSAFDATTNFVYTAPQAGLYVVSANLFTSSVPDGTVFGSAVIVNGADFVVAGNQIVGAAGNSAVPSGTATVLLSDGDTVEGQGYQNGGTDEDISPGEYLTFLDVRALTGHSAVQSELTADEKTKFLRLYSECDRTASVVVF